MPNNAQQIARNIESKVVAIVGRQKLLSQRLEAQRDENRRLRERVQELTAEVDHLKRDLDCLSMMKSVSVTPEQAQHSRALLAGLVREIDRCIADLKAC